MTIVDLVLLLIVAGICGSIGQTIGGGWRGGCLVSIAIGFIGAAFGTWIARQLNLQEFLAIKFNNVTFPVVWSVIGASLFVAVLSFLSRGNRVDDN